MQFEFECFKYAPRQSDSEEKHHKKKSHGGGGAWRAFCSERCSGRSFTAETLAELGEQYRELSEQEYQRYKAIGEAATLAHKSGFQSFPSPTKPDTDAFKSGLQALAARKDAPLPGAELDSGVIVAADSDWDLKVSLMFSGPDSFYDKYQQIKQLAEEERRQRVMNVELGKKQVAELQAHAGSAVNHDFVQDTTKKNMTKTAGGFLLASGPANSVVSFDWVAPVSSAVKAGSSK